MLTWMIDSIKKQMPAQLVKKYISVEKMFVKEFAFASRFAWWIMTLKTQS